MTIPFPGADDFTTNIDNPFFTLRPGTTFVFENKDAGTQDIFTVTRDTVVVDGVTCVVVHDIAMENGKVVEDTFDWFAQDSAGNVWYFGEATQSFKGGNPHPISTAGSWEAGVDGAEAGIIMLADPQVGDVYAQESAPGIAEDFAEVLALGQTVSTPYGTFDGALKTRDVNPLDPSEENKFYVPGVGAVLTTNADGEREELTKVIVNGTSSGDQLLGYAGGDEIFGYDGDDVLIGLDGNDTMHGGRGADDLNGGSGDDVLRGGTGGDSFIFGNLDDGIINTDLICDYRKSQGDVIDLADGGASILAEQRIGGIWQLTLAGDGDVMQLKGVTDRNHDGHIVDDLLII